MSRLQRATREAPRLRRSRSRLCVFERVVEWLSGVYRAGDDAPAVVKVAKSDRRFVVQVARIKGGADFVQRNPPPGKFDIRCASLLADADDRNQFPSGRWDGE